MHYREETKSPEDEFAELVKEIITKDRIDSLLLARFANAFKSDVIAINE
jgi:hypothetical protein